MLFKIHLRIAISLIIAIWVPAIYSFGQTDYIIRKGDPDGIGKWYFNREIAFVMSHYGIGWLERSEREEEENVSLLLKNMDLKPGEIVADIGAGSGYHTERMAKMVGSAGRVKAVDIQPEMLDFIAQKMKSQGLMNIDLVLGKEKSPELKPESVDKILMVDVYHEFEFPREMGLSLFQALKKGGLVYLIEYRGEDEQVPIKRLHKMTLKQAKLEFESIGFSFVEVIENLPWQHCFIFKK